MQIKILGKGKTQIKGTEDNSFIFTVPIA